MGKALLSQKKYEEAYCNFYKGLLEEPNSEELKKQQTEASAHLPQSEYRAKIEHETFKLHLKKENEKICDSLGISYSVLEPIITKAAEEGSLSLLETKTEIQQAMKANAVNTYIVMVQTLINLSKPEEAEPFITKALKIEPNNPKLGFLLGYSRLR